MSTEFADLEDLVSEAIDGLHGEAVRVIGKSKSEHLGRGNDPDRVPLDVIGIVDINPVMAQPADKGQYDGFQVNIGAERIHVSIDEDAFAGEWEPKIGDTIELLEQTTLKDGVPTTKKLTIKDPQPDGLGRIVCVCSWL